MNLWPDDGVPVGAGDQAACVARIGIPCKPEEACDGVVQIIDRAAVSLHVLHIPRQVGKQNLIGFFGKGSAELPNRYRKDMATIADKVEVAEGLGKTGPKGSARIIIGCHGDGRAIEMRRYHYLHVVNIGLQTFLCMLEIHAIGHRI